VINRRCVSGRPRRPLIPRLAPNLGERGPGADQGGQRPRAASSPPEPSRRQKTQAGVLGHDDPNVTMKVYAHLFDRLKSDERVRAALEGIAA
jgi:hypothetical protein